MIAEPRRLALLEAGKLKLAAKARLAEGGATARYDAATVEILYRCGLGSLATTAEQADPMAIVLSRTTSFRRLDAAAFAPLSYSVGRRFETCWDHRNHCRFSGAQSELCPGMCPPR